ncbi:hypothetical protein ACTFIW_005630 [Dictyostelium discoideum]
MGDKLKEKDNQLKEKESFVLIKEIICQTKNEFFITSFKADILIVTHCGIPKGVVQLKRPCQDFSAQLYEKLEELSSMPISKLNPPFLQQIQVPLRLKVGDPNKSVSHKLYHFVPLLKRCTIPTLTKFTIE